MAPKFPIDFNGLHFYTSEAVYQAARYPHRPEIQSIIIETVSPMTGKMKTKKYRCESRPDWMFIQNAVMRWCLRAKLVCNWNEFSRLLLSTEDKPIVEISHRDRYWGTVEREGVLVGQNILGRLLMELRCDLREGDAKLHELQPPDIENFVFMGSLPPKLIANTKKTTGSTSQMNLL
jgi:ribA/ribD-fused uncharacterized protein